MTALLVATSGGHLRQLYELRPRLAGAQDAVWFTLDTPQSRSLLDGEEVVFGHYAAPRTVVANGRSGVVASQLLRRRRFDAVFSTGASLAVAVLPQASLRGIPTHYIESATRVTGPSLTGRILRRVPKVHLYCQYRTWAVSPWRYGGSIFDGFRREGKVDGTPTRILVSLGMNEGYPFRSLLERVLQVAPADAEITWQTGSTDLTGLGIEGVGAMSSVEFDDALSSADVVVAHAGTGTSIASLRAGKIPILVPRRASRGEHIDDHQIQIASELASRGLARHREVDQLEAEDLAWAATHRAVRDETPPPFRLEA
jgi:UDP-N-acetylglucosamine--N-acetylmuramyl-(pentapeptide) pyrophosphoryl-undecaprenol N-acetylglucosamine transferase